MNIDTLRRLSVPEQALGVTAFLAPSAALIQAPPNAVAGVVAPRRGNSMYQTVSLDKSLSCKANILLIALLAVLSLMTAAACNTRANQERRVREILENHRAEWQNCEQLVEQAMKTLDKATELYLAGKYDEAKVWTSQGEDLNRRREIMTADYRSKVLADCKAHGIKDVGLIQAISDKWLQENRPAR